jgi:hypothetical protein
VCLSGSSALDSLSTFAVGSVTVVPQQSPGVKTLPEHLPQCYPTSLPCATERGLLPLFLGSLVSLGSGKVCDPIEEGPKGSDVLG